MTKTRLILWTPERHPTRKRQRSFSPFTMEFLWTLSHIGYTTTEQAAMIYGAPLRTMSYNIRLWRERGLIQSARITYHGQHTRIVTLAREGARILQEDDDEAWEVLHPRWTPLADRSITTRMVEHNLDRNTVALILTRQAQKRGLQATWDTWQTDLTVIHPKPLHIRPDASLRLNGHPVLIEVERSWRSGTLRKKLEQYDRLIMQGGWRYISWCNEPPKVLIVPTGANTQEINFQSWLTTFQFFQHSYAWIWPWPHAVDSQWTIYGGDGEYHIRSHDLWTLIKQPAYSGSS